MSENDQNRPKSRSKTPIRLFRSTNPYIVFCQEFRKQEQNRALKSPEILKFAGERWRKMTIDEKKPYLEVANLTKTQKNNDHADVKKEKKYGRRRAEKKRKSSYREQRLHKKHSRKLKKYELANSICSKCGHKHHHGTKLSKRDSLENITHRRQKDYDGSTSRTRDSSRYTASSTSTASF